MTKGKKLTAVSLLLTLFMLLGVCSTAFATEGSDENAGGGQNDLPASTSVPSESTPTTIDAREIYVSSGGDDERNSGTVGSPFATLTKAVEVASDGATIYVMSNLEMKSCARFYDKHLTITSYGETAVTITRGDGFAPQQDNARSTYNPAMIEVQSTSAESVGLRLENIILDDANRSEGTVFAQAISDGGKTTNIDYVQDAIIASNATVPCTITLGKGAVLRNFGGMSALRSTERAEIVMENGSVIEDTIKDLTRTKGTDAGTVGPAGAIWIQGGTLVMESGSTIRNINGRAVYADGGTVEIGGTISGITANKDAMWQADNGTAIHLRNNAEGTLTGKISDCTDGVLVFVDKATFEMKSDSFLGNSAAAGIKTNEDPLPSVADISDYNTNRNTIIIDGEITGITGNKNPIQFKYGQLTIGSNADIHDNEVFYGTLYIQKEAIVDIYGKINNNDAKEKGGGVATPGHGTVTINMHEGAEIKNNTAGESGGGIMISGDTTFNMYGGVISGNISKEAGGGIYQNKPSSQIRILGGTIKDNNMNATDISDSTTGVKNDLAISGNEYGKEEHFFYVSDDIDLGNKAVYFQTDAKTVSPADDSLNIKLGNASNTAKTALTNASNSKDWENPLATFWAQRDGAATLTVGNLTNLNSGLPVYVLALEVNDKGEPTGTGVQIYAAQKSSEVDTVSFTLPDISGNGYAIAVVQPTADYGTLTISGPETITQNKAVTDYPVTYTVTYDMSESMKNSIERSGGEAKYALEIAQDSRLSFTGDPSSFNGESIAVTYSLPNGKFKAGDFLLASAKLKITAGQNEYIVPSNVTKTQMVEKTTYSLTTQVNGGHGTISASKTDLAAGSQETIIFTPDTGYEIDTVMVNGVKAEATSNRLVVTMDADKTVIVTYKEIPHTHTHSYGTEWKSDADNHWHECSCGAKADTTPHTFKWVTDKEATATEEGSKHEECTVCGYKKAAVEIPATGSVTKTTNQTTNPGNTTSPNTGDTSNVILWVALLFISGGAIISMTVVHRKKKYNS